MAWKVSVDVSAISTDLELDDELLRHVDALAEEQRLRLEAIYAKLTGCVDEIKRFKERTEILNSAQAPIPYWCESDLPPKPEPVIGPRKILPVRNNPATIRLPQRTIPRWRSARWRART